MKTGYSVSDAMTTKPVTIPPSITVRDASKVMRDHVVGSLLVVEGAQLVGIILADDIVHRVTAEERPSGETIVREVMTRELVDIDPKADLYDAMVKMREYDIMHLPVRDKSGKLFGFLTMKDVLRIEPTLFELMGEMAELKGAPFRNQVEGYCEECGNFSQNLTVQRGRRICPFCLETTRE